MNKDSIVTRLINNLSNQKIVTKITGVMVLLLLGGAIGSGALLWNALQTQAQNEITKQAQILTETMNSVRSYTSNNVRPLLLDELLTSEEFISETVPAFSAREVFERFRANEAYSTFFYTEASDNPMNRRNQADEFELDLLDQMYADAELEQVTGYRIMDGEQTYYIARPLRVGAESCLNCHSTPEAAPKNLINTYGPEGGFGWEMGEIIAAQIIYVPASDVLELAGRSFISIIGIFVVVIGMVFLTLNVLLRRFVISPISVMGNLAHKVRLDEDFSADMDSDDLVEITSRGDELGELASVFQRMVREVYERTINLKEQLRTLKIEIDELKKAEEVEEVVGSEFFQSLQSKAKKYKSRREEEEEAGE